MPDQIAPSTPAPTPSVLRKAVAADISRLLEIEVGSFATDRLTRRSFKYLLSRGHAVTLVETEAELITGYVLVLLNAGTSLARLYSLAVAPDRRGRGIAQRLLAAAEAAAIEQGSAYLRLEVRPDNTEAITLYKRAGYREFGIYDDYYEDHMAALRLERRLIPTTDPPRSPDLPTVPYYSQTLDFTCGPAALMMAMKALAPMLDLDRTLELRLWRESTTVFMTSGHGGCGPHGLALAAWRRGFDVELCVNDDQALFLDSVRSEDKKEVMRLVHEDFLGEIAATGIRVHHRTLTAVDLAAAVGEAAIPIVLISSYRLYRAKFPHWVVVTGADDRFIYAHDPLVEPDQHNSALDRINMPIARKDFEHMARYGKALLQASVILRTRPRS